MKVLAAEEFISRFCDIEEFERRYEDNRRDLGAAYIDYVFTVSNAVHAISLPLAAFVGSMCDVGSPKAVIDLGSGFSSYVLRRYAAKQPAHVHVTTADDDPSWLEKTRAFLELAGLSVQHDIEAPGFRAGCVPQGELSLRARTRTGSGTSADRRRRDPG